MQNETLRYLTQNMKTKFIFHLESHQLPGLNDKITLNFSLCLFCMLPFTYYCTSHYYPLFLCLSLIYRVSSAFTDLFSPLGVLQLCLLSNFYTWINYIFYSLPVVPSPSPLFAHWPFLDSIQIPFIYCNHSCIDSPTQTYFFLTYFTYILATAQTFFKASGLFIMLIFYLLVVRSIHDTLNINTKIPRPQRAYYLSCFFLFKNKNIMCGVLVNICSCLEWTREGLSSPHKRALCSPPSRSLLWMVHCVFFQKEHRLSIRIT